MTDNEIIKALKCCILSECENCPHDEETACKENLNQEILDLINRQQAEIERLRKRLSIAEDCILEVDDALYRGSTNDYAEEAIAKYNNLVKEMVGDSN